jgi:hypothetical protein
VFKFVEYAFQTFAKSMTSSPPSTLQMEEESRQRAQDALEIARRHEEEDAMRRSQSGVLRCFLSATSKAKLALS